jgi:hypothetical protein
MRLINHLPLILKQGSLIAFLLFVFCSCSEPKNEKVERIKQDSIKPADSSSNVNLEDKIINAVMALPEVEHINHFIDSFSNHENGVAAIYDGKDESSEDHAVRVGYNGKERFEMYRYFLVNPVTLRIKVVDIEHDTIMPIEDWRKKNL